MFNPGRVQAGGVDLKYAPATLHPPASLRFSYSVMACNRPRPMLPGITFLLFPPSGLSQYKSNRPR